VLVGVAEAGRGEPDLHLPGDRVADLDLLDLPVGVRLVQQGTLGLHASSDAGGSRTTARVSHDGDVMLKGCLIDRSGPVGGPMMRFLPRSVMVGFVDALAILIAAAQFPQV
jgi:hypothetical protein